jgi:isoleucyl-tRNA synthetase
VVPALFEFIEDLTNWYIRLNRGRFWVEGKSADKEAAYQTLYQTLYDLTLSMAPFAPFLAEHIYQQLLPYRPVDSNPSLSVHLCMYPKASPYMIQPALEAAVSRMQNIILLGRQKRNQVKIKTKVPLARLTIIHQDQSMLDEIARLEDYIKSELNVKNVEYSRDENRFIKLYAKPNSPVLGKRLGKNFGAFRKAIEALDAAQLNQLQETGRLVLDGETFGSEDILIFREPKAGTEALSNRLITIDMDCTLDRTLISEGLAREVVNRIQKTRKELGLNVTDRINVDYSAHGELQNAIEEHADHIRKETLALSLNAVTGPCSTIFEVDEHSLGLDIKRQ